MTTLLGEAFTPPALTPEQQRAAHLIFEIMHDMAYEQGPGTPLDGYPGGSPETQRNQLSLMQGFCEEARLDPTLVAEATRLMLEHWQENRTHS